MRTATINKRPVNHFAIVLAALVGLVLHLLQPFAALYRAAKRAHATSRISYSHNRIHALQCRLASIDEATKIERAGANHPTEIRRLQAMKAAACSEIADCRAVIFAAEQELQP